MAFISAPIPQEQQNQFAQPGLTTPNPLSLLPPQAGGSAGAGGAGPTGGQTPTTQFASPASKLSDYLAANQDQTQAQGTKIAGDLSTNYGQITGAIDQAGQGFGQQVSSSYTPYNPDLVSQAAANPADFVTKPENVSGFQSQLQDQYTGPANFESTAPYQNVQNQVQTAVQNAGLVGTQSGLSTYLAGNAKGTYTPGMQTLDSALVQGNAPAFQQITDAAKPYAGLSQYLQNTTAQANTAVPKAQADAQKASQNARDTFLGPTGVVPTFSNALTKGAADAEAGRGAYNVSQQKAYNDLTPLESYLSAFKSNTGYGIDDPLTSLLAQKPSVNPITVQNFSTPDQYKEAAALQQLLGGNVNLPIGQDTVGQAGTAGAALTAQNYDVSALVKQMVDSATNATYNDYSSPGRMGTPISSLAGSIPVPGTPAGEAFLLSQAIPGMVSTGLQGDPAKGVQYERLLNELMGSSNGYVTPNENGPNYYGIEGYNAFNK